MAVFKINEKYVKPVALGVTGLYLCLAVMFFIPGVDIPCKVALPVSLLFLASLFLCPWQMILAMLCSAAGDFLGARDCFIGQMGMFALAHIWMIWFFVGRYLAKVEHDRRLTGKAKGYTAMLLLCAAVLLIVVFVRIVPFAPVGIIHTGVGVYSVLICIMLVMALLQRSSLYALGAVLFVFSDFILAWNMFTEPIPNAGALILVPYFLGQWLIFIRSSPYRIKSQIKLMRF